MMSEHDDEIAAWASVEESRKATAALTAIRERLNKERCDLVRKYCDYYSIEEMEPSDDGEWIRFEHVEPLIAEISRLTGALAEAQADREAMKHYAVALSERQARSTSGVQALWDRVAHRYGIDQRDIDWGMLRDSLEAQLTEARKDQDAAYWRGFEQAKYNLPGSLSTADDVVKLTKALTEAQQPV